MNIKKLLAITLVVIIAISIFAGCDVITKNEERDYSQALATVSYKGLTAEVTKGDFYSSFNSYAYYYVYYYGYTVEETMDLVIDSLAQRELLILVVRDKLSNGDTTKSVADLLNDVEKNEAVKSANETMQSLFDEVYEELWDELNICTECNEKEAVSGEEKCADCLAKEDDDDDDTDEETVEARATRPEVADDDIDYNATLADADKAIPFFQNTDALYKDEYTEKQKEIVGKAIKQLKKELSDNYKSYEYYLESAYETELLSKYERSFGENYAATATEIQAKYDKYITLNKEAFSTNVETNYSTALDSLSSLVYHPASEQGYGYVYNILFKFSDEQTAKLEKLSTDQHDDDVIDAKRTGLANNIITHRSNLSYDAEAEEGEENSNAYELDADGKIIEYNALDIINNELIPALNATTVFEEKLEVIKRYTYMFNDDPGMFDSDNNNAITNDYRGYLITPTGKTSSYVEEFTTCGRNIVANGLGSYDYCITDYGIHFMFVSYIPYDTTVSGVQNDTIPLNYIIEYGDYCDMDKNVTLEQSIKDTLKQEYEDAEYQIEAQAAISANKEECIKKNDKLWKKLVKEINKELGLD